VAHRHPAEDSDHRTWPARRLAPSLVSFCLPTLLCPRFKQAGSYLTEEGVSELIQIVAEKAELHRYATQRLFVALHKVQPACLPLLPAPRRNSAPHRLALQPKASQQLLQVAVWCMGEYADQLLGAKNGRPASCRPAPSEPAGCVFISCICLCSRRRRGGGGRQRRDPDGAPRP
jgi:hypothetical protein